MPAINHSHLRVDARGKVTGATLYPGDISLPGMLHMKILFAGRPHARIKRIDTSKAEAHPGVVAIFTAEDVPVNEYGLHFKDQPVLCGPSSDKAGADVVRFVGDQVALVIAESEEAAAVGRDLIEVSFEDLPVVSDPRVSLQAPHRAPLLFPDKESNVVARQPIVKGDVAQGFAEADMVVEGVYQTSYQEHAFLQPEAGVAYVDEEGCLTLHVAGQWPHEDRRQIAHSLNLAEEEIRIVYPAIGGAFGGREDMSIQIVLALAAWRLAQQGIKRPVKIIWSREESILGHHKRHPMYIKARWGARADGKMVAAEAEIIADAGAYCSTSVEVLGIAAMMSAGPYEIPHVKVDACSVYTNNPTGGAFRGFGAPQASLVAEGQLNKLAQKLDMDPVEIRLRNVLTDGALSAVGTPFAPGVTIGPVVAACAEAAGWQRQNGHWSRPRALAAAESSTRAHPRAPLAPRPGALRRGVGIACGFKNVGFNCGYQESCWARVELRGRAQVEQVILYHAGADVGQGAHTAMVQMAAQAVGVETSLVELRASDTATSGDSGSSSASRMTFMAGNAIRGAAEKALRRWRDEDRPAVGTHTYLAPQTTPFDPQTGQGTPNITYGYVAEAVEVEVDVETGHVRVLDVICADDAGKVINPQLVEGQVEGAVVQGLGYAVLENLIVEEGYVQTPYLSNYLIPTVLDVPNRVQSVLLENPDPYGPFGARGVAEMPLIPMAAAIAAAVADATGVWIDAVPLTPSRVLQKLREAGVTEQQSAENR